MPHITTYDFLSFGEILVDFISNDVAPSLAEAHDFTRFVGGQATNLAINMSRLGNRVALTACVGYDGLGQFAKDEVVKAGINPALLQISRESPTTIAIVTRQTQTPDFIIHRGADAYLRSAPEILDAVTKTKIIHTSAFALSREPARTAIISALKSAKEQNITISLDPNYHPNNWPDTPDFVEQLKEVFKIVDITKPSLEDCSRLFGPRNTPFEYAQIFLNWGAKIVLISMGERGIFLATHSGEACQIEANPELDVKDVTGAGDAYWAGFLTAYLREYSDLEAAKIGQAFAEIKISHVGPITEMPSWEKITSRAAEIKHLSIPKVQTSNT
ncbi:MAG: sugar kinase [Anaerolineales bacterium]|jgi:fructokinase